MNCKRKEVIQFLDIYEWDAGNIACHFIDPTIALIHSYE